MQVLVCEFELFIPAANSLKTKRHVLKSVIERIKSRCNASVAEVGHQDVWQRASVAIAMVGGTKTVLDKQLTTVRKIVDDTAEAEVTSFQVEYY